MPRLKVFTHTFIILVAGGYGDYTANWRGDAKWGQGSGVGNRVLWRVKWAGRRLLARLALQVFAHGVYFLAGGGGVAVAGAHEGEGGAAG